MTKFLRGDSATLVGVLAAYAGHCDVFVGDEDKRRVEAGVKGNMEDMGASSVASVMVPRDGRSVRRRWLDFLLFNSWVSTSGAETRAEVGTPICWVWCSMAAPIKPHSSSWSEQMASSIWLMCNSNLINGCNLAMNAEYSVGGLIGHRVLCLFRGIQVSCAGSNGGRLFFWRENSSRSRRLSLQIWFSALWT